MVYITRKENFCAAHKLSIDKWTDAKNQQTFGKCANKNWHGHNYELIVTVKGIPDKETGFVMDLSQLSRIIQRQIIRKVDHKNFNLDVGFMKGIMPTTENITVSIFNELKKYLKKAKLHSVRLVETGKNS